MVIKRILRPKCRALDFIVFCGKSLLQGTKPSVGSDCLISIVFFFFVTENYYFDSGHVVRIQQGDKENSYCLHCGKSKRLTQGRHSLNPYENNQIRFKVCDSCILHCTSQDIETVILRSSQYACMHGVLNVLLAASVICRKEAGFSQKEIRAS